VTVNNQLFIKQLQILLPVQKYQKKITIIHFESENCHRIYSVTHDHIHIIILSQWDI